MGTDLMTFYKKADFSNVEEQELYRSFEHLVDTYQMHLKRIEEFQNTVGTIDSFSSNQLLMFKHACFLYFVNEFGNHALNSIYMVDEDSLIMMIRAIKEGVLMLHEHPQIATFTRSHLSNIVDNLNTCINDVKEGFADD